VVLIVLAVVVLLLALARALALALALALAQALALVLALALAALLASTLRTARALLVRLLCPVRLVCRHPALPSLPRVTDPHDHLAGVPAAQDRDEGVHGAVDALGDALVGHDPAGPEGREQVVVESVP
jgi:hypothetical protein